MSSGIDGIMMGHEVKCECSQSPGIDNWKGYDGGQIGCLRVAGWVGKWWGRCLKVITVLGILNGFLKKEGTDPVHILKSADSPDQAEVVHCTGPSSRC